jgi:hypothetical protein
VAPPPRRAAPRGDPRRAVRLRPPRGVVRVAEPDERGVPGRGADRCRSEGVSPRGRRPGDEDGTGRSLLGEHPVHGVGGGRDHRARAGGDERLGEQVEDLVRPGAHEQLLGADAVAVGCGEGEVPVVGGRVLGDRPSVRPGAQHAQGEVRGGGGGVEVEADDPLDRNAVPRGDLLGGRLPRRAVRPGSPCHGVGLMHSFTGRTRIPMRPRSEAGQQGPDVVGATTA